MSAKTPFFRWRAMTLAELAVGQLGVVSDVQGNDALASRIMEMGLIPGEQVELIGRAPMGDPLEFRLRGYRLSLRETEARRVLISLSSSSPERT